MLEPGSETHIDIPVSEPTAPIHPLVQPDQRGALKKLAAREANGLVPREHFDLWVYGDALNGLIVALSETNVEEYATSSNERVGARRARVYRRLEKSEFFERHTGGPYLDLQMKASNSATVDAVFAMPYPSTANSTPDDKAATIIENEFPLFRPYFDNG